MAGAKKAKAKQQAKRASKLTKAVREDILARLADGQSLRSACRDNSVSHCLWLDAVSKDEELANHYARAKEIGLDAMAEEILDIADDGTRDWIEKRDDDGRLMERKLNSEHVQRSKLRVDARKWLLAKMAPKKYGDRITNELTGADGGPLTVEVVSFADSDSK